MAVTKQQVAELYVATFNRAPDADGLDYWVNLSGLTIEQIAQSFFDQPETQALYPEDNTNTEFVTSIYHNLFNRAPDAAGLAYWVAELDNSTMTRDVMIQAMKNGALADTNTNLVDKQIILNKAAVALYYADEKGLNGTDFTLTNVTAYASSVTSVKAVVDTLGSDGQVVGQSFALTTGVDVFTGTSANDTFTADNSTATVLTSLADVLNGGAGTDTLTVYGFDNLTDAVPQISNIENIVLANSVAGSTISLANATGVTSVTVKDAAGASTTTVADGVTVTLQSNDDATTAQTVNYSATQTSANLVLNAVTTNTTKDVAVNGAAVTTLNIATTGAASTVGQLEVDAAMATVVITGDKNLTITDAVEDAVNTINASAFTGNLSVKAADAGEVANPGTVDLADITINTGSGADTVDLTLQTATNEVAVNTGAGNDTVKVATAATYTAASSTTAGDVIDGGEGTDTLSVNGNLAASDMSASIKNFEVLEFTADANGTAMTVNKTGINSFLLTGDDIDVVLTGLSAAATVKITDANSSDLTATIGTDTTSDAITITLESVGGTAASAITLNNYDSVSISSVKASTDTTAQTNYIDLASTATSTLTITGDQAIDADAAANHIELKANAAVNLSGLTAASTLDFGANAIGSFTGGSGNDTLKLSVAGNLAQGKTFAGGAGTDSLTVAASASQDMGILALTGFETVNLTTSGANAMDLRNVTGLTTLNIANTAAGTNDLTINRMDASAALKFTLTTNAIDQVVTTIASGTTQNVIMASTALGNDVASLTLDSGVTTLNLTFDDGDTTADEDAGTITTLSGTSLVTINVSGGDDADLGTIDANVTTINASTLTGALSVTAKAAVDTTITGGNDDDTITGNTGVDTIRGGAGADNIDAGTGDTKADVIIFEATGATNGIDVLTIEAGYDKLNFTNFMSSIAVDQNGGAGTAINEYTSASVSDVNITNKIALYDDAGFDNNATATAVAALIEGAGGAFSLTAGGKAILVTGDAAGGNGNESRIWYIDDSLDGVSGTVSATDVVQVAITGAAFDVDTLTTANFFIA